MRFILRSLLLILLIAFGISACTKVPVTSIPKLSRIDPHTTDLSKMAMIAKLPDAVNMSNGVIIYRVTITSGDRHEEVEAKLAPDNRNYPLETKIAEAGYRILSFSLLPPEIAKLNAMRVLRNQWEAEGRQGKGTISIYVDGYCLEQDYDPERLRANIWVRTEETSDFVHAMRNVELIDDARRSLDDFDVDDHLCR